MTLIDRHSALRRKELRIAEIRKITTVTSDPHKVPCSTMKIKSNFEARASLTKKTSTSLDHMSSSPSHRKITVLILAMVAALWICS